jgi:hypothetical protein
MFPNLQAILQQAARMAGGISKTGCKGSYGSYGTPTDETIIRAAWALPEVRLTVSRKLLITTLQRTVTQDSARALKEYKIRFNLVKHTSTPQRLENYCAHRSKIQKQMAALFSSSISRRKSRDASKIFRAMRLQTLAER